MPNNEEVGEWDGLSFSQRWANGEMPPVGQFCTHIGPSELRLIFKWKQIHFCFSLLWTQWWNWKSYFETANDYGAENVCNMRLHFSIFVLQWMFQNDEYSQRLCTYVWCMPCNTYKYHSLRWDQHSTICWEKTVLKAPKILHLVGLLQIYLCAYRFFVKC